MAYVLGVDGGSSKTHALLLDTDGRALGFGSGGCANHQVHGLDPAVAEIGSAVRAALSGHVPAGQVATACFCLAGADLENDYALLQEAMEGLRAAETVLIKNDTLAAMRAGLARSWGVVVICGTGFNASARTPEGQEFTLPGLGPISGDWGGGGTLSVEMIRAVMRAWDGRGEATLLTEIVLEALELPSIDVLLRKLYHNEIPRKKRLALVPLLFAAAEEGDAVARDLVIRMGVEVGVTARALIRRCGLEELDPEVILGGSVFKGQGSLLIDTVKREIHAHYPGVEVKQPRYEPVVGAALLALEASGVVVDAGVVERLEATLPERLMIRPGQAQPDARMEDVE